MCEPATLASLALTAGGGLVSGLSQQNAVNKQNKLNRQAMEISRAAREAEQARQGGFEEEASTAWSDNLDKIAPTNQLEDQQTAANSLLGQFDAYKATDPTGGQFLSGQTIPNGAREVADESARRVAEGASEARKRIAALFNLTGAGTAGSNVKQSFGQTNDILSTIGNLRRGSLGAAQLEQGIPAGTVQQGNGALLGSIMTGVGAAIPGAKFPVSAAPGAAVRSPLIPIAQRNGN